MSNNATSGNCQRNCWLIALAAGVVTAFYLMSAEWGLVPTLVVAGVIFVAVGRLAARMFCSAEPSQDNQTTAPSAQPVATPTPEPTAEPVAEPAAESAAEPVAKAATESTVEPAPTPAAEPAQATAGESLLKPSTPLPGQTDLASRKGTWRYQPEGTKPATKAAKPATKAAKPAGKAPQDTSGQPAALAQARDGGADDLKLIKGVGPKLEGVLNGMGYFHFDQIANWDAADIEWTDQNLVGFKGRVSRDNWVDQAKALAAGEETEFAKRAKRDGIYD